MKEAPRPSLLAILLLGPHIVLGTWLRIVPDRFAFRTTQVVALLHVGLALATLPLAAWWIVRHVRRQGRIKVPGQRRSLMVIAAQWALVLAALFACVTGLAVIWGGNIISAAPLHAACGVAVALPFAWHLWLSSRRYVAVAALALLGLATVGAKFAGPRFTPIPEEAAIPAFTYETQSMDSYEPAAFCGQCHKDEYAEWSRSTHRTGMGPFNDPVQFQRLGGGPDAFSVDLASFGRIPTDSARDAMKTIVTCNIACHVPTSFYGKDPHPGFKKEGVSSEGVTCSFCHTLRAVRADDPIPSYPPFAPIIIKAMQEGVVTPHIKSLMEHRAFFVSAPDTVRRYVGQGSHNWLGLKIASWLIRWRPEVHKHDYHSTILDSSRACLACHTLGADAPDVPHSTYVSWERSPFNTADPKTTVTCQDCHMVRHMTGEPVVESARMVPWGPVWSPGRSHLFLGGNVAASAELSGAEMGRQEHALNAQGLSVAVKDIQAAPDGLHVTVAVRSELVGHYFPALETHIRWGWVEVRALDAGGKVLATTPEPQGKESDFAGPTPFIFRSTDNPKPEYDTLILPKTTRDFVARLALPANAQVARIEASLRHTRDPEPIAVASRAYSAATAAP